MQSRQDALDVQEKVKDDKKKINIIKDENGKSIVIVNDVRFKGKQHIDWEAVREYLKEYVGHYYEIIQTSDKIYIGSDFPEELKGSDKKLYLYDMVNVKKRKGNGVPRLGNSRTVTNPFPFSKRIIKDN